MSDPVQIVIISVITILTVILSLVGVQLLFILREIRKSVTTFNEMLDDTKSFTSKLTRSTESISGMLVGVKTAISLLGTLRKGKDDGEE